ncbi:MAG: hypothetical protein VKI81_05890 [Synechococcaceae cyanobacterium]|nr:hypothetical protein [Synechococcaceae cyanobacterium]
MASHISLHRDVLLFNRWKNGIWKMMAHHVDAKRGWIDVAEGARSD